METNTPTADVEKIAREAVKQLPTGPEAGAYPIAVSVIRDALAQARAPLVEALEEQRGLWELAADLLDAAGDPHVPFMEFHAPIARINAALTGTGEISVKQQNQKGTKKNETNN